jgi:hypothetical protein
VEKVVVGTPCQLDPQQVPVVLEVEVLDTAIQLCKHLELELPAKVMLVVQEALPLLTPRVVEVVPVALEKLESRAPRDPVMVVLVLQPD